MGTMTLSQLRAELLFELRNRTDTATTGGANPVRLDRWLNWAYLHLSHPRVVSHWELRANAPITLSNGTHIYSFNPMGGVRVTGLRSVRYIDATANTPTARGWRLKPRDIRWFDNRTLTTGFPRLYAVEGDTLVLSAVPGANENNKLLLVRYVREPAQLTADGHQTVLDAVWDEVLLVGARYRALRGLDLPEKAELAKQDFAALINEYEDKDASHAEEWDWRAEVVTESYQEAR